jgi:hypothetical protein
LFPHIVPFRPGLPHRKSDRFLPFGDPIVPNGNYTFSDRSDFASQRSARTMIGGFARVSLSVVLALSASATEMGRSSVPASSLAEIVQSVWVLWGDSRVMTGSSA